MRAMLDPRCGLAAAALGLLAAAAAACGVLERRLATAQHELAAANLAAAERGYARAADALAWARRAPWALAGVRAEIAARRAAIRYWQGDHAALLDEHAGAPPGVHAGDAALRLVVAAAAYRAGQRPDAPARAAFDSLDRAIALHAALLEDGVGGADAAFNYELLVRRRAALAAGGAPAPAAPGSPLGREGRQPLDDETGLEDIRIHVPLDHDERDRIDDPTRGGDPPLRRRG